MFKKLLEKQNFQFSYILILETTKLFGDNEIITNGNRYVTRFGLAHNRKCKKTKLGIDFIHVCDIIIMRDPYTIPD